MQMLILSANESRSDPPPFEHGTYRLSRLDVICICHSIDGILLYVQHPGFRFFITGRPETPVLSGSLLWSLTPIIEVLVLCGIWPETVSYVFELFRTQLTKLAGIDGATT